MEPPITDAHTSEAQQTLATVTRTAPANHRAASDDNRSTFLIMTEEVARDGISVNPDGVDTTPFMRNPVVLWQHGRDPQRGTLPIARAVSLVRRRNSDPAQNGWVATLEWYDDDFSQGVRRQLKEGYLNAVSFSWLPLRREVVDIGGSRVPRDEESEMLEFSVAAVPGDRNSLVEQRDATADRTEELKQFIIEAFTDVFGEYFPNRSGATAPAAPDDSAPSATAEEAASDVPVAEPAPPPTGRVVSLADVQARLAERKAAARREAQKRLGRA